MDTGRIFCMLRPLFKAMSKNRHRRLFLDITS
jgi:hypothetical protein